MVSKLILIATVFLTASTALPSDVIIGDLPPILKISLEQATFDKTAKKVRINGTLVNLGPGDLVIDCNGLRAVFSRFTDIAPHRPSLGPGRTNGIGSYYRAQIACKEGEVFRLLAPGDSLAVSANLNSKGELNYFQSRYQYFAQLVYLPSDPSAFQKMGIWQSPPSSDEREFSIP